MALPSLDKTWNFQTNQVVGGSVSALADARDAILKFKNALVTGGWTVWGSSDSVNAGNGDAVDRWSTVSNLVFGSSSNIRSWIVLKNTALNTEAALLLHLNDVAGGSTSTMTMTFSLVGFGLSNGGVNGSTTAAPTANSAWSWDCASRFPIGSQRTFTGTMHVMISSDLECTRVFFTDASYTVNIGYLFIDKAKNPASQWTYPVYTSSGLDSEATILYIVNLANGTRVTSKVNGITLALRTTGECIGNVANDNIADYLTAVDDASAIYPMMPIRLLCSTVGHRNWRKGEMFDIWWGSRLAATGDTYPATGKQFVQFYRIIVPWDTSTINLS